AGHAFDGFLREGAKHDHVDPALEIVRDVAERFAGVEAALRLIDEHRSAAEACHARFEGEARAQRWLFKEHNHLLAGQGALEDGRARFHQFGEMEDGFDALGAEIAGGNNVGAPEDSGKSFRRGRGAILQWSVQLHSSFLMFQRFLSSWARPGSRGRLPYIVFMRT